MKPEELGVKFEATRKTACPPSLDHDSGKSLIATLQVYLGEEIGLDLKVRMTKKNILEK